MILKPRSEWTTAETKEGLIAKMDEALKREVPGSGFSYTQPIEMRFNELIAGARSDIAVSIYGQDLGTLRRLGDQVAQALRQVQALPMCRSNRPQACRCIVCALTGTG